MDANQIAADYFKSYPETNEFHITSDGMAFFNSNDATNHAKSLGDKSVAKVTRGHQDESTIDDGEPA